MPKYKIVIDYRIEDIVQAPTYMDALIKTDDQLRSYVDIDKVGKLLSITMTMADE